MQAYSSVAAEKAMCTRDLSKLNFLPFEDIDSNAITSRILGRIPFSFVSVLSWRCFLLPNCAIQTQHVLPSRNYVPPGRFVGRAPPMMYVPRYYDVGGRAACDRWYASAGNDVASTLSSLFLLRDETPSRVGRAAAVPIIARYVVGETGNRSALK
ncbi:hypothetical protein EVAR_82864_1 [Eumeta japonica]|uniref:Uncharacterized protein n=1 Tax=Eumeta variegata TaxID=151549 RepID=A0A4C1V464_EUMVA|nr:hypothetical protein EVAR_82864_1 [Eumeta japonica]